MANFMQDFAAMVPSLTVLSSFQDATGGPTNLTEFKQTNGSVESQLRYLRRSISARSLNDEANVPHNLFSFITPADRPNVWRELLATPATIGDEYSKLCKDDAMSFDPKIRDDAFRTFKGNTDFWSKVEENTIIRVLKALSVQFGYVQGMNVLLGPFLYIMSEEDSYTCMKTLLQNHIPQYVQKNLDGAHSGSKLFSRCLQVLDPKLYNHIITKLPDLSIFSLRYVLTLFANSKPLEEVLKLWDAIFTIGPHFNIMLLCAKLMLLRDALLKEKRGSKILAILEDAPIVSSTMIDGAFCLLRFVPDSLLGELLVHATERPVSPVTSFSAATSRSQSVSPATAPASTVAGDKAIRALQPPSPLAQGAGAESGAATADTHPVSAFVFHLSPTATTAQYTLNAFASASYDSHDSRSSCASLEPEQPHPVSLANTPLPQAQVQQAQPQSQVHSAAKATASASASLTTSNVSLMKRMVSAEKTDRSHSGSSKSGSGSRPGTARTSPSSSANSSSCNSIDAEEVQAGAGVTVGVTVGSGKNKEEM